MVIRSTGGGGGGGDGAAKIKLVVSMQCARRGGGWEEGNGRLEVPALPDAMCNQSHNHWAAGELSSTGKGILVPAAAAAAATAAAPGETHGERCDSPILVHCHPREVGEVVASVRKPLIL
jgi:hypothetical protein